MEGERRRTSDFRFAETDEHDKVKQGCCDAPPWIVMARKGVYKSSINAMAEIMATSIHERLHAKLSPELHEVLVDDLKEFLNHSISHALLHSVADSVGLAVSYTVPKILNKLMPLYLIPSLANTLTHTITLGTTHTLSNVFINTLKENVFDQYWCYYCEKFKFGCERANCPQSRYSRYYGDFYASYYSEYYGDLFAHQVSKTAFWSVTPFPFEPDDERK